MFDYTVCREANEELFYKCCKKLEERFPDMKKYELLEDVDDTLIQRYQHSRGKIKVKNDIEVDALYVISEFNLDPYFE